MDDQPRLSVPPIGIWTGALDMVPSARAQELGASIEDLGYGAVWLPEVAGRDVFVHLALLLSATKQLIGATGIASIWARDAVTMTGGVKGLTEAFPDRVVLGLGVSHLNLVEGLRGHRYGRPLEAMRTYLDAMDKSPYTAFRPTAPVHRVLAALRPKMLALAAEKAEGAHTYFVTPEHTEGARKILGAGPLLCVEQAVLLEEDPARAREIARAHTVVYLRQPNYQASLRRQGFDETDLADGGSDRLVDAIVAWGDEVAVAGRVRAQLEAGADHVCIQAITAGARDIPEDQWRELAPALRQLATR